MNDDNVTFVVNFAEECDENIYYYIDYGEGELPRTKIGNNAVDQRRSVPWLSRTENDTFRVFTKEKFCDDYYITLNVSETSKHTIFGKPCLLHCFELYDIPPSPPLPSLHKMYL